jgi:hypothetical protein
VAYIRYRPRTVAIDVLLSFNLAVVFNLHVFPFPPSEPQFLGDVPMNRQDAAKCSPRHKYFMFFCVMEGDRGSEEMAREMEIGKRWRWRGRWRWGGRCRDWETEIAERTEKER